MHIVVELKNFATNLLHVWHFLNAVDKFKCVGHRKKLQVDGIISSGCRLLDARRFCFDSAGYSILAVDLVVVYHRPDLFIRTYNFYRQKCLCVD